VKYNKKKKEEKKKRIQNQKIRKKNSSKELKNWKEEKNKQEKNLYRQSFATHARTHARTPFWSHYAFLLFFFRSHTLKLIRKFTSYSNKIFLEQ